MELTFLEKEVYQRLTADATLGGLVDGIFMGYAPEGATKPYLVGWVSIPSIELGFDIDICNVEIVVSIFVQRNGETDLGTAQSALNRVYGDGSSYGLHRWKPTLEGNWSGDTIVAESAAPAHDEDTISYDLRFRMIQSQ